MCITTGHWPGFLDDAARADNSSMTEDRRCRKCGHLLLVISHNVIRLHNLRKALPQTCIGGISKEYKNKTPANMGEYKKNTLGNIKIIRGRI